MDPWYTFCHDSQRTSASINGDITNLTEVWNVKGGTSSYQGSAGNTIADQTNLWYSYTDWSSTNGGTGEYYALNKYDINGNLIWFNRRLGANHCENYPPCKMGPYIVYNDDRIAKVTDSGTEVRIAGSDNFGEICPVTDTTFATVNVLTMEASALHITYYSIEKDFIPPGGSTPRYPIWNSLRSLAGVTGGDYNRSALCYEGGLIFYAPRYTTSSTGDPFQYSSGIYAFDLPHSFDKTWVWFQATTPTGRLSAGNSRIYMVENNTTLVARNQADGTVSWSVGISGINVDGQPPVLAGGKVIIATSIGVYAYNATTGAPVWNTAISNIRVTGLTYNNRFTVMAAALTSNTLVVTADDGIRILDLSDGSIDVFYDPPSIVNRPVNPIIVGNRVYVSDGNSIMTPSNLRAYSEFRVVCLQSNASTPPDTTPPSTPGNPTFSSITTSSMTVSWVASTDDVAVNYYNLFYRQSGGTWGSIVKSTTSHNFTGLLASTTYEFYVNAVDTSGNISSNSGTTSQATAAIPVDATPPSTPGNPTFSNVTTSAITVSWTASTDNVALSYYTLYYRQAGGTWSSLNKTSTSHSFTGLQSSTTYEFYVNATDTSGNVSSNSATTSQTTLTPPPSDTTPPSAPGTPTFSDVTTSSMTVSWTASTDNVSVSQYKMYWREQGSASWILVNTVGLSYNLTGLNAGVTYEVYVQAQDSSGNLSSPSATASQATTSLPVTPTATLVGEVSLTDSTGQLSTHELTWFVDNNPTTQVLQRRKKSADPWSTIYTGVSPYAYVQSDMKSNYSYRVLLDGLYASNIVTLRSRRK